MHFGGLWNTSRFQGRTLEQIDIRFLQQLGANCVILVANWRQLDFEGGLQFAIVGIYSNEMKNKRVQERVLNKNMNLLLILDAEK